MTPRRPFRRLAWLAPALLICLGLAALAWGAPAPQAPPASPATSPASAAPAAPAGQGPVWVIALQGSINPGSARYLSRGLAQAAQDDAGLVVIELDTPGGLADSMRAMVKDILASPVPVAVYVSPAGARAASAGAFLVLAAPAAAMAPASNLGAAHPVGPGGEEIKGPMGDKITEDLAALAKSLARQRHRPPELAAQMVTQSKSLEAQEALSAGLIDLMASDLPSLLGQLEGASLATANGPRRVETSGRALHFVEPSWGDRLLSALGNPNLAYILLMIGLAGLFFELSTPGVILPGIIGGLCLFTALFAMSALPVSFVGLGLLGLALVLFIAELKVVSHGMLSLGGALALVLGSLMLFRDPGQAVGISLMVLVPTVTVVVAFFGGVAYLAGRAQKQRSVTGREGLLGQAGVMLGPGKARVMGEIWRVKAAPGLGEGQEVVVTGVQGLTLIVEPLPETPGNGEG